jgi:hypothetical protein
MSPAEATQGGGGTDGDGATDQISAGLRRNVRDLVSKAAPVAPLQAAAQRALHVGVGLAVLGVQQFQSDRPGLERDLRQLGLPALADATQRAGGLLEGGVARLLRLAPRR